MIDLITGLVGAFLPNFWPYILAAVGVITSLFVARRSGAKANQAKNDAANAKAYRKTNEDVSNETLSADPTDVIRDRLRDRSQR